jgi:hypothetical protein
MPIFGSGHLVTTRKAFYRVAVIMLVSTHRLGFCPSALGTMSALHASAGVPMWPGLFKVHVQPTLLHHAPGEKGRLLFLGWAANGPVE